MADVTTLDPELRRQQEIDSKMNDYETARIEAQTAAGAEIEQHDARQKIVNKKGKQLRFEGFDVEQMVTKFKGTVELDVGQLEPYEDIRFEGTGKVIEIRHKDADGSLQRIQIVKPLSLEVIEKYSAEE